MLPGPDIILECPHCRGQMLQESLMSGNTFGATRWSDGYMEAPMLPNFPSYSRCPHCKAFLVVEKLKELGESGYPREKDPDRPYIRFLRIPEILAWLKEPKGLWTRDQQFLRMELLWLFNHRVRKGEKCPWRNEKEKAIWEENLHELIRLSNNPGADNALLTAECQRYLGNFDKARDALGWVKLEEYQDGKGQMMEQVDAKNTLVFRLN